MIIEVYTDGSATTYDKPGGYAFVIIVDGVKTYEGSGGLKNATNNIAELTAAVKGLEFVAAQPNYSGADVTLVSDSKLVLGYADGSYQCRKLHLQLLNSNLTKLYKMLNAKTKWVRGHTGDVNNERCDQLAKSEREKLSAEEK